MFGELHKPTALFAAPVVALENVLAPFLENPKVGLASLLFFPAERAISVYAVFAVIDIGEVALDSVE
jgi:hypothetical protein